MTSTHEDTLIVTVDQKKDYDQPTPVAVWKGKAEKLLTMDEDGQWGNIDSEQSWVYLVNECSFAEFTEEYGLEPPKWGEKRTLKVVYTWEE
jgi:hypothetical protein